MAGIKGLEPLLQTSTKTTKEKNMVNSYIISAPALGTCLKFPRMWDPENSHCTTVSGLLPADDTLVFLNMAFVMDKL